MLFLQINNQYTFGTLMFIAKAGMLVFGNILMSTTLIPDNYIYMHIYNEYVGGICGIIVIVLYIF